VRRDDLVARFGGDEFVVLGEGAGNHDPARLAERLGSVFDEPFDVRGEPLHISASIGVATSPTPDADTLLRNADAAMYRAKERGRDRIEMFDESFGDRSTSVLRLRSEMREGLRRNEFVLHYQPIVDLATEAIVGMEALVRWIHPDRGMVPPLDFIPEAEDCGFIIDLGAWVIEHACHEAATWPAPMHVAVNLSVRQLADRCIVDTVQRAIASSGIDPSSLVLEVTESTLMANAETALGVLNELRDLGVRLAIDDFGTGYSSLLYLKRMPVDTLKVDRSFVDGLGDDPEDSAIVASVVGLAHAVGIGAVAEGVETQEQRRHLLALGCDRGQGYLWSRPVPSSEVPALLDRR
jgi:EAL domain-containing protein (putative c-di-GMP-specific phosphodiesterase class I)